MRVLYRNNKQEQYFAMHLRKMMTLFNFNIYLDNYCPSIKSF